MSSEIKSSLARVSELGQVTCILCQTGVKSSSVWTAHVNGKQHRDNVTKLKQGKGAPKRSANSAPESPVPKQPKNEPPPAKPLPSDFFDAGAGKTSTSVEKPKSSVSNEVPMESIQPWRAGAQIEPSSAIPEGFFDDADKDAKIRKVDPQEALDEEFARFQKEVQQVQHDSEQIVEAEEDLTNADREIDEIDQQIEEWRRVNELQDRKAKVVTRVVVPESTIEQQDEDIDDVDFESIFDWRSKQVWT